MQREKLDELKRISVLFDSQFRGPFGFRFGLDGILGLFPFFGDIVTSAVSIYIITQAAALGCSVSTITRMAMNVAVENIIDMVPVIGNIFDFIWKANNKNIALLEAHINDPHGVRTKSRIVVTFVILVLLSLMIACGFAAFYVLRYLWFLIVDADYINGSVW